MLDPQAFGGGFVDPVFQSQAVFRAVMDAMARPGSVHVIASDALLPPPPVSSSTAAVALRCATMIRRSGSTRHWRKRRGWENG